MKAPAPWAELTAAREEVTAEKEGQQAVTGVMGAAREEQAASASEPVPR
jgi:hypothetical protein